MPDTDAMLFGRKTYEVFASFWPGALRDLDAAGPHGADKRDPGFAAMARWLNDTHKIVVSKSLKNAEWAHSEITRSLDPAQVARLKQSPGKAILIFGSGSVVSKLSEQRAIDEYRLVICPVLLGQGRTLLGSMAERSSLELVEAQTFKTGNVLLTYRPRR
jgi:dihydrofolate reductase